MFSRSCEKGLDTLLTFFYTTDSIAPARGLSYMHMKSRKTQKNDGSNDLFRRLQQSVNYLRECPLCKYEYGESQADLLCERDTVHLVHITCPSCKNKLVAILAASNIGMSSIGMMTDLTAEDVVRVQETSPVSEDDVLDFHTFMAKHPQRFSHLFHL